MFQILAILLDFVKLSSTYLKHGAPGTCILFEWFNVNVYWNERQFSSTVGTFTVILVDYFVRRFQFSPLI